MAPLKAIPNKNATMLPIKTTTSLRPRNKLSSSINQLVVRAKRKADCSPVKDSAKNTKRSALGDLTGAANILPSRKVLDEKAKNIAPVSKVVVKSKQLPTIRTVAKPTCKENLVVPDAPEVRGKTRVPVKAPTDTETVVKPKEPLKETQGKVKTRLSNEFEKTEESIYASAAEELSSAKGAFTRAASKRRESNEKNVKPSSNVSLVTSQFQEKLHIGNHDVPEGVHNFDKENWSDVNQSSEYAMDIFNYLKENEVNQVILDYMGTQVHLNTWMRSLLVDWMVEIQESFELNHETLYLGVKLVDLYLSKVEVGKETLQLVGATAMFVASKYDERIPPLIDDFLYICDGAYDRHQMIKMEMKLLKVCEFNLGISISYRFLRRYARCAKISMPVLTLARYILEMSLVNYECVTVRESVVASASLYLALRMKKISGWTPTLEFYTGYSLDEIMKTVYLLNDDLHKKPKAQLMTIRNKYSHKIFFEVAKTPLLENEELKP